MSSSKRTPFQDITNDKKQDPKEVKKQRDREWYAKNKDEILKRRRQSRELKKQSTAQQRTHPGDENTLCHTPDTGQSGLTQQQYIAHLEVWCQFCSIGMHLRFVNQILHIYMGGSLWLHGGVSLVGADNESKDPKEVKRQRDRKCYAKNKDDILKRRRQSRDLKNHSTAPVNHVTNIEESEGLHRNDASQTKLLEPVSLTPLSGRNKANDPMAKPERWTKVPDDAGVMSKIYQVKGDSKRIACVQALP